MIQVGDTLQVDHGVWVPAPTSYAYQWYRLDINGQNPVTITGATSATYVVQSADTQHRFQVRVIPSNAAGAGQAAFSGVTEVVSSPFGGGTNLPGWDYGQAMPAWLRVNGVEVANWARTFEYLKAGLGGPGLSLEAPDVCAILYNPDGGSPDVFIDPVTDAAPWFDEGRVESKQFLGVVVNEVRAIPQQSRSGTGLPGRIGGSALSPTLSAGIQLVVNATLIAASISGADYGEEWLRGVLSDPECDTCLSSTVEYRRSCPPDDGSDDRLGYWIAYDSGVTSPPTVGAQDPLGNMTDVSWTWTSENAFLYKPPTASVPAQILQPTVPTTCTAIDDWLCGPGHYLNCVTIDPPNRGAWGTILTVISPDGVGPIQVDTYSKCPPNIGVDVPDSSILITGVHGTLIIDSSQHQVTYISPDGATARDGTDLLYVPDGQPFTWVEVEDCDVTTCVCIFTPHPCSEGYNTTVQLDLQYRRR